MQRPAIHLGIAGLVRTMDVRHGRDAARPGSAGQALNELPQPQLPVAFGFLNVKPEPCIDVV